MNPSSTKYQSKSSQSSWDITFQNWRHSELFMQLFLVWHVLRPFVLLISLSILRLSLLLTRLDVQNWKLCFWSRDSNCHLCFSLNADQHHSHFIIIIIIFFFWCKPQNGCIVIQLLPAFPKSFSHELLLNPAFCFG